jgi:hypothetical protein
MFNKRILAAPVIAFAVLAMSAPQALSGGPPNRAGSKPHPGTTAKPSGAIHSSPQGRKPGGALNYHPTTSKNPNGNSKFGNATSKKPIGTQKHPETGGKTSVTPLGRPKPGPAGPSGEKLPPGVTSLPSANSDPRWWGWGGRWWAGCCDRDERCCRHEHECCHHCPWWSRGCSAGSSPTISSSATIETQPATPITPETSAADIIERMSRALESDRPAKSVDDPPKREKRN